MLSIPVGIVLLILNLVFTEEREARAAACDTCPEARIERVAEHFVFDCGAVRYVVRCGDAGCRVGRP